MFHIHFLESLQKNNKIMFWSVSEVGAALNFDLLNYDEVSGEAFLRVSKE